MNRKNREKGEMLLSLANGTVRIVGCVIFIILAWCAFCYTQYMVPGGAELPVKVKDSMLNNALVAVMIIAMLVFLLELERRVSPKIQWIAELVLLTVTMVWIGVLGSWWIQVVDRVPEGDQAYIYAGASYFLEGKYFFLDEGGYCSIYPHQLALIALTELLFLAVGTYNYFAFQVICVVLTVGIVYLGYLIVKEITDHTAVVIMYCLMMMCCLPLVFYTGWVYGDIPSIFFALLAAHMLLLYSKQGKTRYLVGIVFAITMALLVRKNSLILLIALCLVAGVYVWYKKDKKLVVATIMAVIVPCIAYAGIYKMYEIRSGHERYAELPTLSWVSLGMQENQGRYGWYYDYAKPIFYANDCNAEFTNIVVSQDIEARLEVFKENPFYAWTFYKEKILSQWNEPLYQSLYFSNKYVDEQYRPAPDTLVSKISNEYFFDVLWVCDRLHFLVYLGMACYFLFAVRRKSNILQHLFAVAMIGGFFFSIIWEAKARYILPYYVTMFPCAVIGYEQMLMQAIGFIRKVMRKKTTAQSEEAKVA